MARERVVITGRTKGSPPIGRAEESSRNPADPEAAPDPTGAGPAHRHQLAAVPVSQPRHGPRRAHRAVPVPRPRPSRGSSLPRSTRYSQIRYRSCSDTVAIMPGCRSMQVTHPADLWNPMGCRRVRAGVGSAAVGAAPRSGSRIGASGGGLVSRGGGRVLAYAAPTGVAEGRR
jgi:hypothetical protein